MRRGREMPSLGGGRLAEPNGSRLERAKEWGAPWDMVTGGTVTGVSRTTCRFWSGLLGKWMMVSFTKIKSQRHLGSPDLERKQVNSAWPGQRLKGLRGASRWGCPVGGWRFRRGLRGD